MPRIAKPDANQGQAEHSASSWPAATAVTPCGEAQRPHDTRTHGRMGQTASVWHMAGPQSRNHLAAFQAPKCTGCWPGRSHLVDRWGQGGTSHCKLRTTSGSRMAPFVSLLHRGKGGGTKGSSDPRVSKLGRGIVGSCHSRGSCADGRELGRPTGRAAKPQRGGNGCRRTCSWAGSCCSATGQPKRCGGSDSEY